MADPAPTEVRLKFWGVRGSIPTPGPTTVRYGGNTTCIEIRVNKELIIIDAGTGIRLLGNQLMQEFAATPFRTNLLISHTHWDHIQGFPFYQPAYIANNNVDVHGYSGSIEGLRRALMEQMKSAYFPVSMDQMSDIRFIELIGHTFDIHGVKISTTFTNHPGKCTAYRIHSDIGDIVTLTDHEMYTPQYTRQQGENINVIQYAHNEDQRILDFIKNAHILIADAQYDTNEYQSRVGWGHSCIDDVVEFAKRAQVAQLLLFHHDPQHDEEKMDAIVAHARQLAKGTPLQVDAAREGTEFKLS